MTVIAAASQSAPQAALPAAAPLWAENALDSFAALLTGIAGVAADGTGKIVPAKGQELAGTASATPGRFAAVTVTVDGALATDTAPAGVIASLSQRSALEEIEPDTATPAADTETDIILPAFSWLTPVIVPPAPTTIALPAASAAPRSTIDAAAPRIAAPVTPAPEFGHAEPQTATPSAPPSGTAIGGQAPVAALPAALQTIAPAITAPEASTGPSASTEPRSAIPFVPAPAPANAQTIAQAAVAAILTGPVGGSDDEPTTPDTPSIETIAPMSAAAAPQPVQLRAVENTRAPEAPAPLDTAAAEWIQGMIDHITELRDAGGNRVAHIRLLPDALGAVDIRILREGDTTHVTFTSDNPQARALIAEAAPRLAEMAEQRGIRLGETSIDGGRSGTGSQPAPERRDPAIPAAPASADTPDTESDAPIARAGDRIA